MKRTVRYATRLTLTFAVGAALILSGSGTASATTGQIDVQDEEYRTTTPSDGLVGDTLGSNFATSGGVSPLISPSWSAQVHAHNAHKSGSEASGHVTWSLINGYVEKLKVSSTLKARTSWVTFRSMTNPVAATVYPGGGRGKAAVARYECRNSQLRDWYTYGEIFAPGATKSYGKQSSAVTSIACDGGLS